MKFALALVAVSVALSTSSAFAADVVGCRRTPYIPILNPNNIEYQYERTGSSLVTLTFKKFDGGGAKKKLGDGLEKAMGNLPDKAQIKSFLQGADIKVGTVVKIEWANGATTFEVDGKPLVDEKGNKALLSNTLLSTLSTFIEREILAKGEYGSDLKACN
jgi:hypothetical protein